MTEDLFDVTEAQETAETLRVAPEAILALGDGDTARGVGPMTLHHLRHEPADCDHLFVSEGAADFSRRGNRGCP